MRRWTVKEEHKLIDLISEGLQSVTDGEKAPLQQSWS